MKNFLIVMMLGIGAIGCSLDDDINRNFTIDILPILKADLPTELKKDSIYDLKISYLRPTNCHAFRSFDYTRDEKERIVAIINTVANAEGCKKLENDTVAVDLQLRVAQDDFYVFKFWQGKDSIGENKFLTVQIPVVE